MHHDCLHGGRDLGHLGTSPSIRSGRDRLCGPASHRAGRWRGPWAWSTCGRHHRGTRRARP
ncbi:hypothetical protein FM106_27705 [Brachybacterium faecium]|nr:hypothetical protein FM106_27705 [Brachybacterium faecium]